MKANWAAWWSAAVLATLLMGGIGSLAGQGRVSSGLGTTSLELLPPREWGFGTVLEKGLAWGPCGEGSFVTRRRRLGFLAVSVLTRLRSCERALARRHEVGSRLTPRNLSGRSCVSHVGRATHTTVASR